jgi:hypothetical protein
MRALANRHARPAADDLIQVEIYEASRPAEVPVVHVDLWYGRRDLWVYRAAGGEVRTVTPVRGLPTPLPDAEWLGWPPIGEFLAGQGV